MMRLPAAERGLRHRLRVRSSGYGSPPAADAVGANREGCAR
eukprot:SAG22_NODE_20749_length_263_cov_0.628049_1_plen_40_part_01